MGRLLGLDYGRKRIGVAVTDDLRMIASPLDVYYNNQFLMENIKKICENYSIEMIVIGYPHSEKYLEAVRDVKKFSEKMKREINIPIDYQNEEFSSVYMISFLKSMGYNDKQIKEKIDKYAAQKILQDYLNRTKSV